MAYRPSRLTSAEIEALYRKRNARKRAGRWGHLGPVAHYLKPKRDPSRGRRAPMARNHQILTPDGERLRIFDSFRIDPSLPKFEAERLRQMAGRGDDEGAELAMGGFIASGRQRGRVRLRTTRAELMSEGMNIGTAINASGAWDAMNKTTLPQRALLWLLSLTGFRSAPLLQLERLPPEPPPPTLTVPEFFSSIKGTLGELELVDRRARGYERAISDARKNGQVALAEQLEQALDACRAETQLLAIGQRQYLDEEELARFVRESPKGLRLDWVANFTRVIPPDVAERKQKCDERHIFDNWAVLHYDPQGKSWAETAAEVEARKDPVLFGLVEGRRRLYYIGDWVDEICDLTFDQIADLLGQDAVGELSEDLFTGPGAATREEP